jgi:chromosome segregation ATPase
VCGDLSGVAMPSRIGQNRGVGSLEEIEQRVTAVEAEVAVARQEAAAARALAAGADRDVSDYKAELRGHTRLLSALRETQLEHYAALRETQLEHYAEHKADTAELKAGLVQIVSMLEGLGGDGGARQP